MKMRPNGVTQFVESKCEYIVIACYLGLIDYVLEQRVKFLHVLFLHA